MAQFSSTPENRIAKDVVDAAFKIHTALGPGLLESVYDVVLAHELRNRGHEVARQVPIPVKYDSLTFELGFRADVVVDNLVIVELKAIEQVTGAHKKQLLTHLRLTSMKLGLLINFSEEFIKDGITRIVNGLPE